MAARRRDWTMSCSSCLATSSSSGGWSTRNSTVLPLKFGSSELRAEHWRFLMGAVGNQSTYIRQLQRIMKAHRNELRLDVIRDGVDESACRTA